MYDRILIPVDGSDAARRAAESGFKLAQSFDASVDVLYVLDREARRLARTDDEKRELRERGEQTLGEVEAVGAEFGCAVETALLEGRPSTRICEYAAERDADLVAMGRGARRGLRRRLLGGVTEYVLTHGDVPVLVVPESERRPREGIEYERLLLPTDGSENAEAATDHGVAIAGRFRSKVHVLNVADLQSAGGLFSAGGLEREFVERLESRGREATQRVAERIESLAPDVDFETDVVRTADFDGVAPGIHDYAVDREVDLVVMGSHGRSNLRSQLLGSVTSELLRGGDLPVLVVKRES
ncbi:universal stress protein (plasmid) [Halorussus salilacus]|uniref:universal stress protein n=1 Tax=Halorussus salilacus TaxID=2953750 RepID=UPI00209F15A9|nr:universal stress protein [Halorussus salilacus]USZ69910.1 universal stress protein [Halorussus salilacus]